GNYSGWVSIGSPFLELISIYSTTNDEALGALLLLVLKADGAVQEVIASDLRRAYKIDPVRFSIVTKKMDLNLEEILVLMEDE
ncbi:MAG: GAF domain-containing protein, partial [Parvicella sp.]